MAETQRRFSVMGENLFKITNRLINNPILCRLLKYQDPNPLDETIHPNVNGVELLHKQIVLIPKYPEDGIEYSYVLAVFEDFSINPANPDFKLAQLRFDVVCPYTEWIINEDNLRPYLLMEEVDKMFNQANLSGIGKLQFIEAKPLVLSPQVAGYSLYYSINEFN